MSSIKNWIMKYQLTELSVATILLSIIYLAGWFCNGYLGMHFSCSDLISFYTVIVLKNLGQHGINSVFNSQKGEPPAK
jgi:hypothetical protein